MHNSLRPFLACALILVVAAPSCATSQKSAPSAPAASQTVVPLDTSDLKNSRYRPVAGTRGMVVSDDRVASEWGAEILRRGGNAIDAAVATGFALAVTRPHFGSLGGGGFLLYCPAPKSSQAQKCQIIDYRETAPAAASPETYRKNGKADPRLAQVGALASGVPGVTAGLLSALEKFGSKPRKQLLERPIALARQGVLVTHYMEKNAVESWDDFNSATQRILGCPEKSGRGKSGILKPCVAGEKITQPDLARTLEAISARGRDGFYRGAVARQLVHGLSEAGGILTTADLANYQPQVRAPITMSYEGPTGNWEIVSMPPPSNGGTGILQMFSYATQAALSGEFRDGYWSPRSLHALTHGMSLAFADRAAYFGDPGFTPVPMDQLLSRDYLARRWTSTFKSSRANIPSEGGLGPAPGAPPAGQHTTHFSVIDAQGNAVAVTTTINGVYGSGFTPPGTGVIMNNEMDDFSLEPGVANQFGLVGSHANAVAPGKRPLSSMSPTIARDVQGNNRVVIGAAGGPRITTSVFQALFNRLYFGLPLPEAMHLPRIHHQWKPARVLFEKGAYPASIRESLRDMGYAVEESAGSGIIHALERQPGGRVWGVPEPRGEGAAVSE
ncbi:MAG: gamma-glutamyltransferase [Bacteriovoracia bacterium]